MRLHAEREIEQVIWRPFFLPSLPSSSTLSLTSRSSLPPSLPPSLLQDIGAVRVKAMMEVMGKTFQTSRTERSQQTKEVDIFNFLFDPSSFTQVGREGGREGRREG